MPEYDVELEVTYYTDAELDQMAADEVIAKITAIGTVTYTPESKALIDAARTATRGSATGINAAKTDNRKTDTPWYSLDGTEHYFDLYGRPLNGKPTKGGVYVKNGKKVVIK